MLALPLLAAAQQTGDYQVESAYLYNFARMAHWPTHSLAGDSELIIGVLGGNEDFLKVLRDTLTGKNIDGHPLEIRQLHWPQEIKFCHVVFFRTSEPTTRSAVEQLGKSSVLLVGEDKDFLNEGGMINLVSEDGRMTYQVNAAAIERSGLRYADTDPANMPLGGVIPEIETDSSRSLTFRSLPQYPRIAASLNIVGTVQLQAVVRADGTVKEVRVLGGHPALAEAAVTAVMKWRFEPGARETTEPVRIRFGQ
jgi:TonB family protein